MATIKFYIRRGKSKATIYTHFNISATQKIRTSTGLYIDPKHWNERKGQPKQNIAETKKITAILQELERTILQHYNDTTTQEGNINKDWLKNVTDIFFNRNQKQVYFTDLIQEYINNAPTRKNRKGGYGLSTGRVERLKDFKKNFEKYQFEVLKKPLTIDQITQQTAIDFRDYFLNLGYSVNFAGGNLANFKTICKFFKNKGDFKINLNIETIEPINERKETENIITLSIEELKQIEEVQDLPPICLT